MPGPASGPPRAGRPLSGRPIRWRILLRRGSAVLLLFAVAGELGLRLADLRAALVQDPRCAGAETVIMGQRGVFQLDDAAGYVTRPDLCVRLKSTEFDGVLRTNRRGLPGPDVPVAKDPGEIRIVVLGDSYAAGGQMPYEDSFPALLEQRLRGYGHPGVRVIDAAVGGWTTRNEAGYLRANLGWLQPDIVVVAAFLGNDVGENVLATVGGYRDDPEHPKGFTFGEPSGRLLAQSPSWFPRNGLSAPPEAARWASGDPLPTPVPNSVDPPEIPEPFWGPIPERVRDPSPSVTARNVARWAWEVSRNKSRLLGRLFGDPLNIGGTTAPGANAPTKTQRQLNVAAFEWLVLRDRPPAYWLDLAWPLFGSYLAQIRQAADSVGAPTLVMAIPQIGQFDDSARGRIMDDYRFAADEVDWERPQRELAGAAADAGVPVLDLVPRFRAQTEPGALVYQLDQHFTRAGNEVVANALAQHVLEQGWLR